MVSWVEWVLINPQKAFSAIDHEVLNEVSHIVLVSLVTISNNFTNIWQIENSRFWRILFRSYHVVTRVSTGSSTIFHSLMIYQTPVHSFLWKPFLLMEAFIFGAHWNNRTINLLIVFTWPLSAVINPISTGGVQCTTGVYFCRELLYGKWF